MVHQSSNRNDCNGGCGGKKTSRRADPPKIPPHIKNFFKYHKISFPTNGEVKITPLEGRNTQIEVTGRKDPMIKIWGVKRAVMLTFKDGACIDVNWM